MKSVIRHALSVTREPSPLPGFLPASPTLISLPLFSHYSTKIA